MSIKDRLTRKTEGLFLPSTVGNAVPLSPAAPGPLRTSPGQMLMVNSLMKESNAQVVLLENRLKAFEGVLPVRLLAAEKIVRSQWANRIVDSFKSDAFNSLKEEIEASQGNVQPIKVRPVAGAFEQYEIVFGHRRHQACLELNLPVLALVEHVSDKVLFKEMDRENRNRLDLSPWEQGMIYRRSLNENLFVSLGELSKEIGIDKGNLSKALRLADLPEVIVKAFASPLDLQFRFAKLLHDALERDKESVLARAEALADKEQRTLTPKTVLDILLGITAVAPIETPVILHGKVMATVRSDGNTVSVQFAKNSLSKDKILELHTLLANFLLKT